MAQMQHKNDPILSRIHEARSDRSQFQEQLNAFYSLAIPHRHRIGATANSSYRDSENDQEDLFDTTLQDAVTDFASDQMDYFMPHYKRWVPLKPGTDFSNAEDQNQWQEKVKPWETKLYDLIRQTNWYQQNFEIMHDLAGAAGGTVIPATPRGQDIKIRSVLMGNLLMDEGGYNDLDGRWDEFYCKQRHLKQMFPNDNLSSVMKAGGRTKESKVHIIQGCHREMDSKGNTRWRWTLYIDKKRIRHKLLPIDAPAPMNVARWRQAPPNPWGPGPGQLALTNARILDELAYLNLRKEAKEADPPMSYVADGVFNPDGGVDNGTYLARQRGSDAPKPMYEPSKSQSLYFDIDKREAHVKRALFQDKPEQEGKTPPSASQWLDEKNRLQTRYQARHRVFQEYVVPSLNRFAYVFAMRGELEPIKINGQTVQAVFENPLSKASDAAEVSAGIQFASTAIGTFQETGLASIDAFATLENWKKKLGDDTVVLKKPDQQEETVQNIVQEGRNIV